MVVKIWFLENKKIYHAKSFLFDFHRIYSRGSEYPDNGVYAPLNLSI